MNPWPLEKLLGAIVLKVWTLLSDVQTLHQIFVAFSKNLTFTPNTAVGNLKIMKTSEWITTKNFSQAPLSPLCNVPLQNEQEKKSLHYAKSPMHKAIQVTSLKCLRTKSCILLIWASDPRHSHILKSCRGVVELFTHALKINDNVSWNGFEK